MDLSRYQIGCLIFEQSGIEVARDTNRDAKGPNLGIIDGGVTSPQRKTRNNGCGDGDGSYLDSCSGASPPFSAYGMDPNSLKTGSP